MKTTGLFGKNSGRVGGVVFSNYRGEQIVRSYQPKVKNPSTKKQVEQRQKFKLVSQIAASLGKEIKLSYRSDVAKETARNSWLKNTLKKVTYEREEASLSVEDIVLTNSSDFAFSDVEVSQSGVRGDVIGFSQGAIVRVVQIGYNAGKEIVVLSAQDVEVDIDDNETMSFNANIPVQTNQYSKQRLLIYAYEPTAEARESYGDYEIDAMDEEAVLYAMTRFYSGNLRFSATTNVVLPQNV